MSTSLIVMMSYVTIFWLFTPFTCVAIGWKTWKSKPKAKPAPTVPTPRVDKRVCGFPPGTKADVYVLFGKVSVTPTNIDPKVFRCWEFTLSPDATLEINGHHYGLVTKSEWKKTEKFEGKPDENQLAAWFNEGYEIRWKRNYVDETGREVVKDWIIKLANDYGHFAGAEMVSLMKSKDLEETRLRHTEYDRLKDVDKFKALLKQKDIELLRFRAKQYEMMSCGTMLSLRIMERCIKKLKTQDQNIRELRDRLTGGHDQAFLDYDDYYYGDYE